MKAKNEPLFSSHMVDFSEESVDDNLHATEAYFRKIRWMNQFLEMEIGITGGEEDGVNNEKVEVKNLKTQPKDINDIYQRLSPIGPNFTIAAGFGNVHGVYTPGNVQLEPSLLKLHQEEVKAAIKSEDDKPVFLVFHGGSGSKIEDFKEAIGYGVVKVACRTIRNLKQKASG